MVTMTQRGWDADIAKFEYLASVFTVVTGIEQSSFDKKVKALDALKDSMTATVHQDVYKWGYYQRKREMAVAEKKREADMLGRLAELGKAKK